MPRILVAFVLLAAILSAGCATSMVEMQVALPGHAFHELNLRIEAGATVSYEWHVEGEPVEFDVHTHRDGQVHRFDAGVFQNRTGNLTPEEAGALSLFWRNPTSNAVVLDYRVSGRFDVDSTVGP